MEGVHIVKIDGYNVYLSDTKEKNRSIKKYSPFIGIFARIFKVAIGVHDEHGKYHYLNKDQYTKWLEEETSALQKKLKSFKSMSEIGIGSIQNELKKLKGEVKQLKKIPVEIAPEKAIHDIQEQRKKVDEIEKKIHQMEEEAKKKEISKNASPPLEQQQGVQNRVEVITPQPSPVIKKSATELAQGFKNSFEKSLGVFEELKKIYKVAIISTNALDRLMDEPKNIKNLIIEIEKGKKPNDLAKIPKSCGERAHKLLLGFNAALDDFCEIKKNQNFSKDNGLRAMTLKNKVVQLKEQVANRLKEVPILLRQIPSDDPLINGLPEQMNEIFTEMHELAKIYVETKTAPVLQQGVSEIKTTPVPLSSTTSSTIISDKITPPVQSTFPNPPIVVSQEPKRPVIYDPSVGEKAAKTFELPAQREGVQIFGQVAFGFIRDYLKLAMNSEKMLEPFAQFINEDALMDFMNANAPDIYRKAISGETPELTTTAQTAMGNVLDNAGAFFKDYSAAKTALEKIRTKYPTFDEQSLEEKKKLIEKEALKTPALRELLKKPMNPLVLLPGNEEAFKIDEAKYISQLAKKLLDVIGKNIPKEMQSQWEFAQKLINPEKVIEKVINAAIQPALFSRVFERLMEKIPLTLIPSIPPSPLQSALDSGVTALKLSKSTKEYQQLIIDMENLKEMKVLDKEFKPQAIKTLESFISVLGTRQDKILQRDQRANQALFNEAQILLNKVQMNNTKPEALAEKMQVFCKKAATFLGADSKVDLTFSKVLGTKVANLAESLSSFVGLTGPLKTLAMFFMKTEFISNRVGEEIQKGLLDVLASSDLLSPLKLAQTLFWDEEQKPVMQDLFSITPEQTEKRQEMLRKELPKKLSLLVEQIAPWGSKGKAKQIVETTVNNLLELVENEHVLKVLVLGYIIPAVPV